MKKTWDQMTPEERERSINRGDAIGIAVIALLGTAFVYSPIWVSALWRLL